MRGAWASALHIAGQEIRGLVLSVRGVVFVLVVALAAVGTAATLGAILDRVTEETGVRIEPGVAGTPWSADGVLRDRLEPYAEGRPLVRAVLHRELSAPGALIAWVFGFVVPWLIVIVGHARMSDERRSGYQRFLFLRVHRGAYFGGKALGLWLFATLASLLAVAGHGLWWQLRGGAPLLEVSALGVRLALFTFPYVTLTLFASTLVSSTTAALAIATLLLVGLGFAATVLDAWMGSPLAQLWFGHWTSSLWAGDVKAGLVFGASGVVLAGAAVGWLRWRDA